MVRARAVRREEVVKAFMLRVCGLVVIEGLDVV